MSIDYILQKIQHPDVSSQDLTQYLLYYFNQLAGRSGFSTEQDLATVQRIFRTIVQHPSWNYEQSSSQITLGFYPDFNKTFGQEQQRKHTLAFEVFLDAIDENQRQQFVQEYLDVLHKVGAGNIPCIISVLLNREIDNTQTRPTFQRKI